jgi:hypothetical protein
MQGRIKPTRDRPCVFADSNGFLSESPQGILLEPLHAALRGNQHFYWFFAKLRLVPESLIFQWALSHENETLLTVATMIPTLSKLYSTHRA